MVEITQEEYQKIIEADHKYCTQQLNYWKHKLEEAKNNVERWENQETAITAVRGRVTHWNATFITKTNT